MDEIRPVNPFLFRYHRPRIHIIKFIGFFFVQDNDRLTFFCFVYYFSETKKVL